MKLQADATENEHYVPDYMPNREPRQLFSLDTRSGTLTEGPMLKSNLHSLHSASLLSPNGDATMLMTGSTIYSVLELPSLNLRGRLTPPSAESYPLDPVPIWQAWTCRGFNMAILWTIPKTNSSQVAVSINPPAGSCGS